MDIVKFYRGDPKNAPRTTMPAHLGANAILVWDDKLLLERRRDADVWGLVGGGCKKTETGRQAIAREVYEELGLRIPAERFRKLKVIVVYGLEFAEEPVLRVSRESRELRFFTREELRGITIAVTHEDIVEELFVNGEK